MKLLKLPKNKFTMIDDEDYDLVSGYNWRQTMEGYVTTHLSRLLDPNKKQKGILLHRLIMNVLDDKSIVIDHKNGNILDNRRKNLRICSPKENSRNRKCRYYLKYKGIEKLKSGKFRARILINKKRISLGIFNTEENAALAYNEAAIKYYGEFANLNIIKKEE